MKRTIRILGIACLAITLGGAAADGEERRGPGASPPQLKMEALEVRGLREKPGVLYVPVPEGIYFISPARFDLFRDDVTRPVLPQEVSAETLPEPGYP